MALNYEPQEWKRNTNRNNSYDEGFLYWFVGRALSSRSLVIRFFSLTLILEPDVHLQWITQIKSKITYISRKNGS